MRDAPTFGHYAETPNEEMTPERQEGYRVGREIRSAAADQAGSG